MDKHSKRNKDKYNPYTLLSNKDKNIYVVVFKDNRNKTHNIEVSKDIYNAFDRFELEDISQMHKYERHIEHSEVYEETIYSRSINKQTLLFTAKFTKMYNPYFNIKNVIIIQK